MSGAKSSAAMPVSRDPLEPALMIEGHQTDATLNDSLFDYIWKLPSDGWKKLFGVALAGFGLFGVIASGHRTILGCGRNGPYRAGASSRQ